MYNKVSIVGLMHSGKTTLARALEKQGYTRFAFADPVKDVAAKMLTTFSEEMTTRTTMMRGWRVFNYDDMNEMKGDPSIRKLLQLVGTELGRDWFGPPTVWIDLFEKRVNEYGFDTYFASAPFLVVNDDCRFPNEAGRLTEMDFTIIKLVRDENERRESVMASLRQQGIVHENDLLRTFDEVMSHPSETNVALIEPTCVVESVDVYQLNRLAQSIADGSFQTIMNGRWEDDGGRVDARI